MSLSRFFKPRPPSAKRPRDDDDHIIVIHDDDDHIRAADAAVNAAVKESDGKSQDKRSFEEINDDIVRQREEASEPQEAAAGSQSEETPLRGAEEKKEARANRFAKFACSASSSLASEEKPTEKLNPKGGVANNSSTRFATTSTNKPEKQKAASESRKWIPIKKLSDGEQKRIVDKWHSLVQHDDDDDESNIEDCRFLLLVSALLHARCQEPVVRKAMNDLRQKFQSLSVDTVAKLDPQDIQGTIKSLQYYNTKAKYMVQAAKEIQTRHGGIVPEDERALIEIKGIGPVFADLLATINTRAMHQERRRQLQGGQEGGLRL